MFGLSANDRRDIDDIRRTAEGAVARITSHEQVCAERQGEIRKQLDTLQRIQWGMATGVMTTMVGILIQLAMHFFTGK